MNRFISTSEAAALIGVSASYVTQLARDKKLVFVSNVPKEGYRFARGNIQKYIWWKKGLDGILEFPAIKEVVKKVGADIENFFGDEPGCIIFDIPGGFLHGIALFFHLNERKKDITLACMGRGAITCKKEALQERKILLVDDFSRSGRTLEKMEEMLKKRCKESNIKIKEIAAFVYDKFSKKDAVAYPGFFIRDSYEEHLRDIDIRLE